MERLGATFFFGGLTLGIVGIAGPGMFLLVPVGMLMLWLA